MNVSPEYVGAIETALEAAIEEKDSAVEACARLERQAEMDAESMTELEGRASSARAETARRHGDMLTERAKADALRNEIAEQHNLQSQVHALSGLIGELRQAATEKAAVWTKAAKEQEAEIARLRSESESMTAERDALMLGSAGLRQRNDDQRAEIERLVREANAMRDALRVSAATGPQVQDAMAFRTTLERIFHGARVLKMSSGELGNLAKDSLRRRAASELSDPPEA